MACAITAPRREAGMLLPMRHWRILAIRSPGRFLPKPASFCRSVIILHKSRNFLFDQVARFRALMRKIREDFAEKWKRSRVFALSAPETGESARISGVITVRVQKCERPGCYPRPCRSVWCGREDSNFHGSYPTATSTLRVYQFRHDRISVTARRR